MPRFRFEVHDGRFHLDPEQVELPDVSAACLEAVRLAGQALIDNAARIARRQGWMMDIMDEEGNVLYHLTVSMKECPTEKHFV